ncbi:MAG: hypothetical protein GX552_15180 [Chloroflexi bacterium]|jgi:predicted adenine nucleotide alpha hydrolase (AANH) superfamily ATPase|nr:hypothetical protein [Chloroflexota bacterium]
MRNAVVLDNQGNRLSPCSEDKARKLLAAGKAELVSEEPLTIRLPYAARVPAPEQKPAEEMAPGRGKRILLHICCGPCATYTVQRLRQEQWQVTGYWFNPNIHPFSEHERRRETLAQFAEQVQLPVLWEQGYAMPAFLRAVAGRERFRERCAICYRMRLESAAQAAAREGYDAFTTTLLISPYQDQRLIRAIGEELAQQHGVAFYFENFRQGFAEHHRLAEEYGLYKQRFCGCIYSEWEALDREAATHARPAGDA